jgi:hypothetical protein
MSSKSKAKTKPKEKNNTIKLVFPENLIKSLNKMYEKQNQELMKAVSEEKTIPIEDLLKFIYDQKKVIIPLNE